jgi:hypothetical protein
MDARQTKVKCAGMQKSQAKRKISRQQAKPAAKWSYFVPDVKCGQYLNVVNVANEPTLTTLPTLTTFNKLTTLNTLPTLTTLNTLTTF